MTIKIRTRIRYNVRVYPKFVVRRGFPRKFEDIFDPMLGAQMGASLFGTKLWLEGSPPKKLCNFCFNKNLHTDHIPNPLLFLSILGFG